MAVDQDKIATDHTVPAGWLDRIVRSPRFVTALEFIAFEIAYFLAFRLATSFGPGSFSPLWFPSSILLCALLKNSPERWWLFIAGTVPVRILGQPIPISPCGSRS